MATIGNEQQVHELSLRHRAMFDRCNSFGSNEDEWRNTLSHTLREVRTMRESIDELKSINQTLVKELKALRLAITETLPDRIGSAVNLANSGKDCFVVVPRSRSASIGSDYELSSNDAKCEDCDMAQPTANDGECLFKAQEEMNGDNDSGNSKAQFGFSYDPEIDLNLWLRR